MGMKRIYHPTLNDYRDVDSSVLKSWTDAGWKTSNDGHVTANEGGVGELKAVSDTYPFKVGEGAAVPTVGTLETASHGDVAVAKATTNK